MKVQEKRRVLAFEFARELTKDDLESISVSGGGCVPTTSYSTVGSHTCSSDRDGGCEARPIGVN